MKIYELNEEDVISKPDAHFALAETGDVDIVKKINRIIARAEKKGFDQIGVLLNTDWGLKDLYFYFGDKKTIRKRIKK